MVLLAKPPDLTKPPDLAKSPDSKSIDLPLGDRPVADGPAAPDFVATDARLADSSTADGGAAEELTDSRGCSCEVADPAGGWCSATTCLGLTLLLLLLLRRNGRTPRRSEVKPRQV